jgi:hypothetical protein
VLLNKIPVLDKGYVAYVDSSGGSRLLTDLSLEFFRSTDWSSVASVASLTLAVKCPLFVQLNLSKFNLSVITATHQDALQVYCPNVGEIGSPEHDTNAIIADDISRTSEALLINPTAYQQDGCDKFISQVLMPVGTYTTLIVCGSYNEWSRFCEQNNAPTPVAAYINAVKQVMKTEWQ